MNITRQDLSEHDICTDIEYEEDERKLNLTGYR